jgi:hypothetical protein
MACPICIRRRLAPRHSGRSLGIAVRVMSSKRYLTASWGLGILAIVGCTASHSSAGPPAVAHQRSYPSASEAIITVARYHSLEAGARIAKLLVGQGTRTVFVAGSEEGVVMAGTSEAAKVRAIIAEAVKREQLDATITDR